ncbi:PBP1A family penicillin-binding protein [Cytobacillus sp. S13-E01]|uniref:transglycosylase domain-containing protein n=1 Tax=Cytobacillus sp. S13-E01 TaxID=3031326 RepID=UPI0023D857A7|nr:PBP1A family penicillin-binding protein [Cytobacillus sp. S13-E01]MDF0726657.1 PBP1A family penicillin-binding protein [Cytobacillus sp. S13-E01]
MEIITSDRLKSTIKYLRALFIIGLILSIFLMLFFIGILSYAKTKGAPPLAVPQTTLFYASDGSIIGESHRGEKRYWVPLTDIAPAVIDATISIEDRNFFLHNGFDYKRIVAAALADIKAMAKVQGASTITQQYARNLFLEHEKTWNRKITEALYTVRLEMNYSKKEILEGYLNTIYYGHGAYGIEAASNFYFGKSAKDLTLSEASMLAGIPKGPSRYSPFINKEKAKSRQLDILQSMVTNGYISKRKADEVYNTKLSFITSDDVERNYVAPYFQDIVKKVLQSQTNIEDRVIEMGGLRVYTTLDPKLQKIAEEQMSKVINPESNIQLGFIAMNQYTGEVKALIGGRNYEDSPFNRVTQAQRQPGSTFKPFLYYAALENGFTPSTELRSEVTTFRYDEGNSQYTPQNYNNYYANDQITLAQALALSDNVYAVKTHVFIGENDLVNTAKKLGISSKLVNVPSLALGTSSVKVIDMVNAYSIIANGGKKVEPIFIKKVVDHKGDTIYEAKSENQQILDPNLAFVTTHMMTGIFDEKLNDYTRVTGQTINDKLTRQYAGKTGSTQTDSWMIGFSPQLTAGIWTGYDRDEKITLTAEKLYTKQIWANFMEEAHKGLNVLAFKPPDGVKGVYVNPDNGKLATESCPVSRLTYYVKGTEPTEYCTDHLDNQITIEEEEQPLEDKNKDKGWFKRIFDWF